jgi:hypothetical protein
MDRGLRLEQAGLSNSRRIRVGGIGDQICSNNRRSEHPRAIRRRISYEATSLDRSSPEDRHSYSGRPTRLDRMRVDM